jgi:hypothetical protein
LLLRAVPLVNLGDLQLGPSRSSVSQDAIVLGLHAEPGLQHSGGVDLGENAESLLGQGGADRPTASAKGSSRVTLVP